MKRMWTAWLLEAFLLSKIISSGCPHLMLQVRTQLREVRDLPLPSRAEPGEMSGLFLLPHLGGSAHLRLWEMLIVLLSLRLWLPPDTSKQKIPKCVPARYVYCA